MKLENKSKVEQIKRLFETKVTELEAIQTEQSDFFDGMSEVRQMSIEGREEEECADALQDALDQLQSVIDSLTEALGES